MRNDTPIFLLVMTQMNLGTTFIISGYSSPPSGKQKVKKKQTVEDEFIFLLKEVLKICLLILRVIVYI